MGPNTILDLRKRQVTFLRAVVPQFSEFKVKDTDEKLLELIESAIKDKVIDGDNLLKLIWNQIFFMKV